MINERRRHIPSFSVPTLYLALEIILAWLVISFFEFSTDLQSWSLLSIFFLGVWALYALNKYFRVLGRQRAHHINKFEQKTE